MHYQAEAGFSADADFFDWLPDPEPRFFLAPELAMAHGYALRAPMPALPAPPQALALTYGSELPRSSS